MRKVRGARGGRVSLAMRLRKEKEALRKLSAYSRNRHNKRHGDNQVRQLVRVHYLKSVAYFCGLNNFREWIVHVAKTSPRRSNAHYRLVQLFDGLFALRQWRDSHPAFQHAQRCHRALTLRRSIRRLKWWEGDRLSRHRGMRRAFWTAVRSVARRRLSYWKMFVSSANTHRLVMSLGWSCFRSKRLKYAIKQWKDRVYNCKNYRMGRKTVGSAFQKVIVKRTRGSMMLDGRAVLHGALRLWTDHVCAPGDQDRNMRDGMLVRRRDLRCFFTLFKKLTLFKKRWSESSDYQRRQPIRGPNKPKKLRSVHALFYRLLVSREKKNTFETFYSYKGTKKPFMHGVGTTASLTF